jgi:hypothetical protein
MQPGNEGIELEPKTLDGRPFLGDKKVVSRLVQDFVTFVLQTLDDFHAGKIGRDDGIAAIESKCMAYGGIFAGTDEAYQSAPWMGSRLAGRVMACVPGSKWGASRENAIAEYFRWLSKQVIHVHTEMLNGMADEEAGPVVQAGIRSAIRFLMGMS